jgi:hypothetical protein
MMSLSFVSNFCSQSRLPVEGAGYLPVSYQKSINLPVPVRVPGGLDGYDEKQECLTVRLLLMPIDATEARLGGTTQRRPSLWKEIEEFSAQARVSTH